MPQPNFPDDMRARNAVMRSPICVCRKFEASAFLPPAPAIPDIDPAEQSQRIFPSSTLPDCPEGATRRITEHAQRRECRDFDGRRWPLYRMLMREVCAKGGYRKERDLVLGEWSVSEELAGRSLYNVLKHCETNLSVRVAPVEPEDVPAFDKICSACGKFRE